MKNKSVTTFLAIAGGVSLIIFSGAFAYKIFVLDRSKQGEINEYYETLLLQEQQDKLDKTNAEQSLRDQLQQCLAFANSAKQETIVQYEAQVGRSMTDDEIAYLNSEIADRKEECFRLYD